MSGDHPVLELDLWQRAEWDDIRQAVQSSGAQPQETRLQGRISPRDLYCYLKARLGPPGGLGMDQRLQGADTPFQWSYFVKAKDCALWIDCHSCRVGVRLASAEVLGDAGWDALFQAIKADFASQAKRLSEIKNAMSRWKLVVNPYRLLEFHTDRLEKKLQETDTSRPTDKGTNPEEQAQALSDWYSLLLDTSVTSSLLAMAAPVMGESYLNLLIYLLAHDEVCRDDEMLNSFLKMRIDLRVKSLYRLCSGFREPIPTDAKEFKAFHTVMNWRNEVLHGNLVPHKTAFDEVWIDHEGKIPLFQDETPMAERLIFGVMGRATPEQALKCLQDVRSFISFLGFHLDFGIMGHITTAARSSILAWDAKSRRFATIFNDQMVGLYERMWCGAESQDEDSATPQED